ncbi:MAG: hypothetical protein QOD75_2603 [Blastocatellia bacterium]|jgi:hypothetical protein|nr:hypothetical protein [Blastocatellia bacterium]
MMGSPRHYSTSQKLTCGLSCALLLSLALAAAGQTQTSTPAAPRGVVRLRVRVKLDETSKRPVGLGRKRFFLIKGSLAENKALVQSIEQRPVVSRDCFYRGIGASPMLIAWLTQGDCESIYCREVAAGDLEGPNAVPEFQQAVAAGEKEFGSPELARKWLAVNLRDEVRSGFYKRQQQDLQALLKQTEAASGAKVISVMTDQNGTAYFTGLEPGTYLISNLLPSEIGNRAVLWNCEVTVKPGDLATEKPFLISNPANKEKNVRCMAIEKPLPACPAAAGSPTSR